MTDSPARALTLGIDVGGSAVKALVLDEAGAAVGRRQPLRVPLRYPMAPDDLLACLRSIAERLTPADRVSVGCPGMIRHGRVLTAPHFPTVDGPGSAVDPRYAELWDRYDLRAGVSAALRLPARVINDAEMHGLAVVQGRGLELVITLGTGLGTALFDSGRLAPHLELSHHPFAGDRSYDQTIGDAVLAELGPAGWTESVSRVVAVLRALIRYDRLYIGGGNARHLTAAFVDDLQDEFPEPVTIVENINGILGGVRLWEAGQ